jgi:TCP-1/cpn60 chaperonin family
MTSTDGIEDFTREERIALIRRLPMRRRTLQGGVAPEHRNAGFEGSIIVEKIRQHDEFNYGFNAQTEEYQDLVANGVSDAAKVTRSAMQNASSISGLMLPRKRWFARFLRRSPLRLVVVSMVRGAWTKPVLAPRSEKARSPKGDGLLSFAKHSVQERILPAGSSSMERRFRQTSPAGLSASAGRTFTHYVRGQITTFIGGCRTKLRLFTVKIVPF